MTEATCPGCGGPWARDETGQWLVYADLKDQYEYWHETTQLEMVHADTCTVLWRRCYRDKKDRGSYPLAYYLKTLVETT